MRRCALGDHRALSDLHALFAAPLLGVARAILRSPEEAEEIVQEVFLYAWQHASEYDPRRAAVSTWLGRIARSRAIDRLRRSAVADRARSRLASEGDRASTGQADRRVSAHEWRRRLGREMSRLPEAQRQTLMLAYYGDLTQREIAEHLQIPLGTVKTRTHLALRKLRAARALHRAATEDGLSRVAAS